MLGLGKLMIWFLSEIEKNGDLGLLHKIVNLWFLLHMSKFEISWGDPESGRRVNVDGDSGMLY